MAGILNSLQSLSYFSLLRSLESNSELITVQKFSKILTEFRSELFLAIAEPSVQDLGQIAPGAQRSPLDSLPAAPS